MKNKRRKSKREKGMDLVLKIMVCIGFIIFWVVCLAKLFEEKQAVHVNPFSNVGIGVFLPLLIIVTPIVFYSLWKDVKEVLQEKRKR